MGAVDRRPPLGLKLCAARCLKALDIDQKGPLTFEVEGKLIEADKLAGPGGRGRRSVGAPVPALGHKAAVGFRRRRRLVVDDQDVRIVWEDDVVFGHAAVVGVEAGQGPYQQPALTAVEGPATHDYRQEGRAELGFERQSKIAERRRDIWTSEPCDPVGPAPGLLLGQLSEGRVGLHRSQEQALEAPMGVAFLNACVLAGADLVFSFEAAGHRRTGSVFGPMAEEEGFDRTCDEVDRHLTHGADQTRLAGVDGLKDMAAGAHQVFVAMARDEAASFQHLSGSQA